MNTEVICPSCGNKCVKNGIRTLSNGDKIQRYKCKFCGEASTKAIDEDQQNDNKTLIDKKNTVKKVCPYCENILTFNPEDKIYTCNICSASFNTEEKLESVDYKYFSRKSKEVQRKLDELRIQNKMLREDNRRLHAMEDIRNKLVELFSNNLYTFEITGEQKRYNGEIGGILQLSDTHFNELILSEDNVGNVYDFKIASSRCYQFVQEAKDFFDAKKISRVWFCMTGDLLNSDRRLDEMIMKCASRGQAWFVAKDIIRGMIFDLLNHGYELIISGVSGNESRFDLDMSNTHVKLSDNFDFLTYQQLKLDFANTDKISFIDIPLSGGVVEYYGKRIFVSHGLEMPTGGNSGKNLQMINGKMCFKGTPFDYAIYGHEHSTNIGDTGARSSSLPGSNVYSDKRLNLAGRSAQNIHLVCKDYINSIKIDLQQYYDGPRYKYNEEFEVYDRKSVSKAKEEVKLIRIY